VWPIDPLDNVIVAESFSLEVSEKLPQGLNLFYISLNSPSRHAHDGKCATKIPMSASLLHTYKKCLRQHTWMLGSPVRVGQVPSVLE
jgi:hypothetical protein